MLLKINYTSIYLIKFYLFILELEKFKLRSLISKKSSIELERSSRA